jgi:predicted amidohydrolase
MSEAGTWTTRGWSEHAARPAISPRFFVDEGSGALAISGAGNEHAFGYWARSYPVTGGCSYRLRASFRFDGMDDPNLHLLTTVLWGSGAEGECAQDHLARFHRRGDWVEGEGIFTAPAGVESADVRLYLRYSPAGTAWWRDVSLEQAEPLPSRPLRLAVTQGSARGCTTAAAHLAHWAPLVAEAAAGGCDLLLLPEFANACGRDDWAAAAEPIPGGESFAQLSAWARQHRMWIAAGLVEGDGDVVYNACALIDREGHLAGKYRKVHPYWPEEPKGIGPGDEVPVFPTEFGTIGVMICYDSWWPEVARLLGLKGAELILFPNAGYEERILPARAIDNGCYVACSSLGSPAIVLDTLGRPLAERRSEGVVWASLDLAHKPHPHPNAGGSMNHAPGGQRATRNARSLRLYREILDEVARWDSGEEGEG